MQTVALPARLHDASLKAGRAFTEQASSLSSHDVDRINHIAGNTSPETKMTVLEELNRKSLGSLTPYEKGLSLALTAALTNQFDSIPREIRAQAISALKVAGAEISSTELFRAGRISIHDVDQEKIIRVREFAFPNGQIDIAIDLANKCLTKDGAFEITKAAVEHLLLKEDTGRAAQVIQDNLVPRMQNLESVEARAAALTEIALLSHACNADASEVIASIKKLCFSPEGKSPFSAVGIAAVRTLGSRLSGDAVSDVIEKAGELEQGLRKDISRGLDEILQAIERSRGSKTVKRELAQVALETIEDLTVYDARNTGGSQNLGSIAAHVAYRELYKLLDATRDVLTRDQIESLSRQGLKLAKEFRASCPNTPRDHDILESERHIALFLRTAGDTY